MTRNYFLLLLWVLGPVAAQVKDGPTIKKCQDEQGRTYYVDVVTAECKDSSIKELGQTGLTIRETAVPPTREELAAEKETAAQKAKQQALAKAQAVLDDQLIKTYDNEESIILARDQRLSAIDRAIAADQTFITRLEAELAKLKAQGGDEVAGQVAEVTTQIQAFSRSIRSRTSERSLVEARYNEDLSRYRRLRPKSP